MNLWPGAGVGAMSGVNPGKLFWYIRRGKSAFTGPRSDEPSTGHGIFTPSVSAIVGRMSTDCAGRSSVLPVVSPGYLMSSGGHMTCEKFCSVTARFG